MQDTDAVAQRNQQRLRYMIACALLLFVLGSAVSALAQTAARGAPQLEVRTADKNDDSCLRTEPLRLRIAHYMAHKSAQPGLRVVVDLKELASSDNAELRIYRADALLARRRFERLPVACDDRRDAVALSIALALDDPAVATPTESSPSATGENQSAVVVSPANNASESAPAVAAIENAAESGSEPSAPKDTARPDTTAVESAYEPVVLGTLPSTISHTRSGDVSLGLQLQLGARWLVGALPFPVWVGGLGIALPVHKHVSVALTALASTLGEIKFESGLARGRLYGLEATGCSSLPLGAADLELCGGAALAACDVSGRDYPMARPDTTLLWAAGLARVALRWPAAATFSFRPFVQGHINLSRPTLQVERATRDLKPGWLGASGGLELVITLP